MNRKAKNITLGLSTLTFAAVTFGMIGCGGGGTTNNDQGAAVSLLGYFQDFPDDCEEIPDGLTGFALQLGDAAPEPQTGEGSATVFSSSAYIAIVGLQNNLYRQYFRGDRLLLSYFIAGATRQPPSTQVPVSLFAGPGIIGDAEPDDSNLRVPINSSLPPSFTNNNCNRVFAQTIIVPAAIRAWMNFNRNALPEPPFTMEVTAKVSGLSSAGDRFETNAETIFAEIEPESFVEPPEGTGDNDSSGLTGDTSQTLTEGTGEVTNTDGDTGNTDTSGDDSTGDTTSDGGNTDTSSGDGSL